MSAFPGLTWIAGCLLLIPFPCFFFYIYIYIRDDGGGGGGDLAAQVDLTLAVLWRLRPLLG